MLFLDFKLSPITLVPDNFILISFSCCFIILISSLISLPPSEPLFALFLREILFICFSISLNLFLTIVLLLLSLFICSNNIAKSSLSSSVFFFNFKENVSSSKSTGTSNISNNSFSDLGSILILFFEYALSINFNNFEREVYLD